MSGGYAFYPAENREGKHSKDKHQKGEDKKSNHHTASDGIIAEHREYEFKNCEYYKKKRAAMIGNSGFARSGKE